MLGMPAYLYDAIYLYTIMFFVVIVSLQGFSGSLLNKRTASGWMYFGVFLAIMLTLFIGLRPLSGLGDTGTYYNTFKAISLVGYEYTNKQLSEPVFYVPMRWFAQTTGIYTFFVCVAMVYICGYWFAAKRLFGTYQFYCFLMILASFGFLAGGVNGIRIGMALSLFFLAISFHERRILMIVLCLLALGTQKSTGILIGAAFIAWFIKKPKLWLAVWFLSIAASYVLGDSAQGLIAGLGIQDDRFTDYLTADDSMNEQFSKVGWRWDFLIYSALPVVFGWYFIFKRRFKDNFYIWIFSIYLIANSFWLFLIRIPFTNRFASLSWSLMPLIFIYPFFKEYFWEAGKQQKYLGMTILIYFLITFILSNL